MAHYIYQKFTPPREANLFLSIQQNVRIQRSQAFHGKISDQLTPTSTISIRKAQQFHVQLQRQSNSLLSSRSSTSSGSSMSSRLTRSILRILGGWPNTVCSITEQFRSILQIGQFPMQHKTCDFVVCFIF